MIMIGYIIFQEFVLEKTSILARSVLVLNRLLLPLVLIFYPFYTNTIEMPLPWPELPLLLGYDHYWLHHPIRSIN
jgi:hypothetical protein